MLRRIVCGDCLDPLRGMPSLPDKSVDSVITDPPYEKDAHTKQIHSDGRHAEVSFDALTSELRVEIAKELVRISRGWVIVFCQVEAVGAWKRALVGAGAKWRRGGIWVKEHAQPKIMGDGPGNGAEAIAIAWAGKGKSVWNGGGRLGIFTHSIRSGTRKKGHETEKPMPLMRELVALFTGPKDVVCDPFLGGGSTFVACRELGRGWVGWEIQKKYFKLARKRIKNTERQNDLVIAAGVRNLKGGAFGQKKRKQGKLV